MANVINGTSASEIIGGSNFDDVINGGSGDDTIDGHAGDDILIGGPGGDHLLGNYLNGLGDLDAASYANAPAGVSVNLAIHTVQDTLGAGVDYLQWIFRLIGSAFDDRLTGDVYANLLEGGAGDDTLIGATATFAAGNDTLDGGAGDDYLQGALDGDDVLDGGSGTDTVAYSNALAGVRVNLANSGPQNTNGAGRDKLVDIEDLIGSGHDDDLTGDGGANDLQGLAGDDALDGAGGDDKLWGGLGDDDLSGGNGDDYLAGGLGKDLLDGDAGFDTVQYFDATSAVTVSLAIAISQNTGGAGVDILTSIEGLNGSPFNDTFTGDAGANNLLGQLGDDTLVGGAGADYLDGGAGNDTVSGGSGQDAFVGSAGNDVWDGGADADAAYYSDALAGVTVNLATVGPQNTGGAGVDTLTNIEQLIGSAFNDSFTGGSGDDNLLGKAGNDTLVGGDGDDSLAGGAGNDSMSGGAGYDWVRYYVDATAGVTVSLATAAAQNTGGAGIDTLTGIEALIGTGYEDNLTGDAANNYLDGLAGNDTLVGGAGDDYLYGGEAVDTLIGIDTARYLGSRADYERIANSDGSWTVRDRRPGSPEGTDTLRSIELLSFSDGTLATALESNLELAFANVLRLGGGVAVATDLAGELMSGLADLTTSASAAIAQVVSAADQSTAVATMSYQFFTGRTPSAAGLDYLVSPTGPNPNNINSAYYQSFNIENRYINFAVNLGKVGEGAASFLAEYGAKTLFQATKDAYAEIFGGAPTDLKIGQILDTAVAPNTTRAQYFAYYGGDGLTGIGTKAAMVGWLLTEAAKADIGVYARANNDYLTDLSDGSGPYLLDLIGQYGKSEYVFAG